MKTEKELLLLSLVDSVGFCDTFANDIRDIRTQYQWIAARINHIHVIVKHLANTKKNHNSDTCIE